MMLDPPLMRKMSFKEEDPQPGPFQAVSVEFGTGDCILNRQEKSHLNFLILG